VAADDENVQHVMMQPHSPSKPAGSGGIARSTNSVDVWHHGLQTPVTVPVSPSNSVESYDWDSAGHSAPESTISTGCDWSDAPVGKKISITERSIKSRPLKSRPVIGRPD